MLLTVSVIFLHNIVFLFYRSLDEINRLWNEDLNPSEDLGVQQRASSSKGLGSNHIGELAKVSGIVRWVLIVYGIL